MKTIRQIADEIGVSKQAVYKRYKGKLYTACAPYAHTVQGVLYLSEQAETLIKQDFLKADRSNGAHTERPIGAVSEQLKEADVVSVLQATIDPEEMEELASQPVPYASTTRWTNVSLSGTEMSKKFEVTSSYPYAKVWISNQGKGDIQFTITRGSDTGTLVSGSDVTIKAGTSTSVYSTNSWPADAYYANFTCGSANMKGLTSCRVASTQHELDI